MDLDIIWLLLSSYYDNHEFERKKNFVKKNRKTWRMAKTEHKKLWWSRWNPILMCVPSSGRLEHEVSGEALVDNKGVGGIHCWHVFLSWMSGWNREIFLIFLGYFFTNNTKVEYRISYIQFINMLITVLVSLTVSLLGKQIAHPVIF